MRATPTKIRRRRHSGEVSIEQTQDAALIEAMLDRAATSLRTEIAGNRECFLIAYLGEEPVGIAGLQTEVDAALMRPVFVVEERRGRAIGGLLVSAVRHAAYARGARTLYTMVPPASTGYFLRLGFGKANDAELPQAFGQASDLRRTVLDLARCRPLSLDLSQEGPVAR